MCLTCISFSAAKGIGRTDEINSAFALGDITGSHVDHDSVNYIRAGVHVQEIGFSRIKLQKNMHY